MRVELHDEARAELAVAAHYYDGEVPGLGARYLDQMWRGVGRILDSPHIGAPQRTRLQKLVTSGPFRYSIIYVVQSDAIFVVVKSSRAAVGLIGLAIGLIVLAAGLYVSQGAWQWLSSLSDSKVRMVHVALMMGSVASVAAVVSASAARRRCRAPE